MKTIKLRWLDVNRTGQGYKVYKSSSTMDTGSLPEPLTTLPLGTSEYEDTAVSYGDTWYYIISSIDENGNEVYSDELEILARENIYGATDDGVVIKFTYDIVKQWENHSSYSEVIHSLDVSLSGKVLPRMNRDLSIISADGIQENRMQVANTVGGDYRYSAVLRDDRIVSTTSDYNSAFTSMYSIIDVNGNVLKRYASHVREFLNYKMSSCFEDSNWLVTSHMSGVGISIRDIDTLALNWENTYIPSGVINDTAFDSVGYLYAVTSDGGIYKFYPDPENYAASDPAIWQDTTTLSGKNLTMIYADRDGSMVVTADDNTVAKIDANGNFVWNVTLTYGINDIRIDYDSNILVATSSTHVLRLDGTDGSTLLDVDIGKTLVKIATDPGIAHIQNGTIIDF